MEEGWEIGNVGICHDPDKTWRVIKRRIICSYHNRNGSVIPRDLMWAYE